MTRIRNNDDYRAAMDELEQLMEKPLRVGSPEAERLDVLSLLVDEYEKKAFPIDLPTPVEAIRFRMEQLDLDQRDLIPYIGSRSRVSEVLNGKRPLTLTMIRALHKGLEIPAAVLLNEQQPELTPEAVADHQRFPLSDMKKLGWIQTSHRSLKRHARELMEEFAKPLGGFSAAYDVRFRRTQTLRSARTVDPYAIQAWCMRVRIRAKETAPLARFSRSSITNDVLRSIAQLSSQPDGPLRAKAIIQELGIRFVVERHLPRTQLDGAALLSEDGTPILALTLRHDRLDSFWFSLLHEMIHIARHLGDERCACIDNLESPASSSEIESEADRLAGEALVPSRIFRKSRAYAVRNAPAVLELASTLDVHPAVVAGRIRHESGDYRILSQLLGHGEVQRLFPAVFGTEN